MWDTVHDILLNIAGSLKEEVKRAAQKGISMTPRRVSRHACRASWNARRRSLLPETLLPENIRHAAYEGLVTGTCQLYLPICKELLVMQHM